MKMNKLAAIPLALALYSPVKAELCNQELYEFCQQVMEYCDEGVSNNKINQEYAIDAKYIPPRPVKLNLEKKTSDDYSGIEFLAVVLTGGITAVSLYYIAMSAFNLHHYRKNKKEKGIKQ